MPRGGMSQPRSHLFETDCRRSSATASSGVSAVGAGLHVSDEMPAFLPPYRRESVNENDLK
jgi:hypothetical protein